MKIRMTRERKSLKMMLPDTMNTLSVNGMRVVAHKKWVEKIVLKKTVTCTVPGHVEPIQKVLDGHIGLVVHSVRLFELQHTLGHRLNHIYMPGEKKKLDLNKMFTHVNKPN